MSPDPIFLQALLNCPHSWQFLTPSSVETLSSFPSGQINCCSAGFLHVSDRLSPDFFLACARPHLVAPLTCSMVCAPHELMEGALAVPPCSWLCCARALEHGASASDSNTLERRQMPYTVSPGLVFPPPGIQHP